MLRFHLGKTQGEVARCDFGLQFGLSSGRCRRFPGPGRPEVEGWKQKVKITFSFNFFKVFYCDKICVYDEHPIAGKDIQY